MTLDDVKAMIGKTYTRDGNTRTVYRIDDLGQGCYGLVGKVYWKRPGGKDRIVPQDLRYFLDWMKKAREWTPKGTRAAKLIRELVEQFDESEVYILDTETKDAIRTLLANVNEQ